MVYKIGLIRRLESINYNIKLNTRTQLSPFLDESIEETTANIIKCDYCFPPEHWGGVDERAQQMIRGLLEPAPARRLAPRDALTHTWFDEVTTTTTTLLSKKTPFTGYKLFLVN